MDFRFEIPRPLVETVTERRAVDWSNALFLSCRFRAWRRGPFNEYVYNFFKSLSPERMALTEAEATKKLGEPEHAAETIEVGGYEIERFCPHRGADLTVFGELDGCTLTCTLHGWEFDLDQGGRCKSSSDRSIRVRKLDGELTPAD
ncbi:MAG: Rieske 2Fe-2S domain-containing protein [Ilumatobacteraceae bacterium]